MPYSIRNSGNVFEVVDDSGKVVGTHPTRKQAIDNMKALYASVADAAKEVSPVIASTPLHGPGSLLGVPGLGGDEPKKKKDDKKKSDLLDKLKSMITGGKESVTTKGGPGSGRYPAGSGEGETSGANESWKTGGGGRAKESVKVNGSPVKGTMTASHVDQEVDKPSGLTMSHSGGNFNFYRHSSGKIAIRGRGNELTDAQHVADVVNNKTGFKESATKEGRRNSTPDAANLQQIHDLSVLNGAACPMVFKESSGKLRWVLMSSNSYQDTDKEIVSQAALEADVERADKEKNYGPLRWWHVGNPDPIMRTPGQGVDIGDCDFNAMHGRILIESGTFRDERIGGAIKEHADTLAGSIGFFHPLNQPDAGGVFTNIQRFERSLLPRVKASNQLTALTVSKEQQDMATMKEKYNEFVALLGGNAALADSVVKQAEQTEKAAQETGLAFKAAKDDKKKPLVDEAETPEEAAAETAADEEAEATDNMPENFKKKVAPAKKEAEFDYAELATGLAPHITALIDARVAESRKETSQKELGLTAQINALETKLKEVEAVAKTLAGDLPRSVKDGYRASQSGRIITEKEAPNQPQPDPLGDFYGWVTESLGKQPGA